MKVKELIVALWGLDLEAEVILQADAEGNGYSPLRGVDGKAIYIPDNTWSGSVYDTEWDADDAGMDEESWEEMKRQPLCVVLHPIN